MTKLILVKHSVPEIDPALPAHQWRLSNEGRTRCGILAERLAEYELDILVSSVEPKADMTAQIVARLLSKPHETMYGLQEHDRSNVGLLSKTEFETKVAEFFSKPDQLVFGKETADQSHSRFDKAISTLLEVYHEKNVAVVTHGTVLTLFVSRANELKPFPFWKELGLPAFVVLSLPGLEVIALESVV